MQKLNKQELIELVRKIRNVEYETEDECYNLMNIIRRNIRRTGAEKLE